jgi:hypothetical protein
MLKNERHVRAGLAAASQPNAEDEGALLSSSLSVGDDGRSMRLSDVNSTSGGSSKLAKSAIGSSAVQAALTLLPCIHVAGCGEASPAAMHAMFSAVGPCRIHMFRDEETGKSTGELSCTYDSAAAAMLAIERFDCSRFDDGYLEVSVSKTAAQGSLTKRGRGRNSDRMTQYDMQQQRAGAAMAERARAERDAFAAARADAATREPLPIERDAFTPSFKPPAAVAERVGVSARKRSAAPAKLPSFMVKRAAAAQPVEGSAVDDGRGEGAQSQPDALEGAEGGGGAGMAELRVDNLGATRAAQSEEGSGVSMGGGLLGLDVYGGCSDSGEQ